MFKKARLLTHPTLARRDAPSPKQGRSSAANPRFTFHASRFTVHENEAGGLFQHPAGVEAMSRLLVCPPDYFGIEYEINPWMRRSNAVKVGELRALV